MKSREEMRVQLPSSIKKANGIWTVARGLRNAKQKGTESCCGKERMRAN